MRFIIYLLLFPFIANADLLIHLTKESNLPYSLSSSNYTNSSSNYANSISNYNNSPSNYNNSESNYVNSSSNYNNSSSGENRLMIKRNGSFSRVGYYVVTDDGLVNFFSTKGKRVFYSPTESSAIFDGQSGDFCGSIAVIKGKNVLALTEKGQMALLTAGETLKEVSSRSGSYSGNGSSHWIQKNVDSGTMIILEDGSVWKIDPIDKIDAMLWLPISNITVAYSEDGTPGYNYLLINTDDKEKAHAMYLGNN